MKRSLCLLVALLFSIDAHAGDIWGQESLRGFQGPVQVAVSMAYCTNFNLVFAFGLGGSDHIDLKSDLEAKLRLARIPTTTKAGALLLLNIHCLPVTVGDRDLGYAVHMQLALEQSVIVENTKQYILAATWQNSESQICSSASCPPQIRSMAKDMTDDFLNDLLKANEAK
jgi:hypothetical protein